jgi:hypothetical protein
MSFFTKREGEIRVHGARLQSVWAAIHDLGGNMSINPPLALGLASTVGQRAGIVGYVVLIILIIAAVIGGGFLIMRTAAKLLPVILVVLGVSLVMLFLGWLFAVHLLVSIGGLGAGISAVLLFGVAVGNYMS